MDLRRDAFLAAARSAVAFRDDAAGRTDARATTGDGGRDAGHPDRLQRRLRAHARPACARSRRPRRAARVGAPGRRRRSRPRRAARSTGSGSGRSIPFPSMRGWSTPPPASWPTSPAPRPGSRAARCTTPARWRASCRPRCCSCAASAASATPGPRTRRAADLAARRPSARSADAPRPLSRLRGSVAIVAAMSDHDLHDRGLAFDLETIFDRRHALKLFAGAGLATLIGCGSDETTTSSSTATATATATASADCETIPGETAGPYPGDGSNGPNVLTESGIVRDDIRSSFGDSSGTAEGVPLTVELTVVDTGNDCAPLDGRRRLRVALRPRRRLLAVLRGDHRPELPARRAGGRRRRQGHVHDDLPGRVHGPLAAHPLRGLRERRRRHGRRRADRRPPSSHCPRTCAPPSTRPRATSRASQNLAQTSLDGDMVFSDGADAQLAAVEGDVDSGYTATLTVAV